ncbi:DUF3611 family protein [Hassallia byssoidea VB512170]|uniref:DUF3611 family protein n=1 Tax=Hassallia byssoidea VB512170 TaxID=1304833 RepID=A0A846HBH3_9CYAN|nr:DUF3611 family protein [Hassalia byssoidea]NEU74099.1 DUF3611 family protein [Hassalia byssoidea VB512170]
MSQKPRSQSSSSPLEEIAQAFRLTGWISFWSQLVLGVIASGILVFASLIRNTNANQTAVGTGLGIFFAVAAVINLAGSIFWAFRYTRIARQLQSSNPNNRPRKAETMVLLRTGLIVNLVGLILALVGAEAIVGALLAKALTLPQQGSGLLQINPSQIISALDIVVVQANTQTLVAHFIGLMGTIWLLNRVTKPQ